MDSQRRKWFGTDGVRDVANRGNMTPETALCLGRAFVLFLAERGITSPRIVVGRDTRRSGTMLEAALSAGMASEGAEVLSPGVIPTPGVSFAVRHLHADGGAVVSASHNPAEYNGIKFLDHEGCKLSDEEELCIEGHLENLKLKNNPPRPEGGAVGVIRPAPELTQAYAERLASLLEPGAADKRGAVVFDCANGAAGAVMPLLDGLIKDELTKRRHVIANEPDGMNINDGVGVMHMDHLGSFLKNFMENKKDRGLGFAFDGDADRVLVSDSKGRVIDGDIILWTLARWLSRRGLLGSGVVVTVMSNMALEGHLERENIPVFRCPVGDRYVLDAMRKNGARLGGEQSGHIIADAFTATGDGLCTAILFLNALHELDEDPDTLIDRFGRFPQRLSNLTLRSRELLDANMEQVNVIVSEAQARLGDGQGRVFIRPSGTEPLLRILVEAREASAVESVSGFIVVRLRGIEGLCS